MILDEGNEDELNLVIDTNTKGMINSIKAAYRHMKKYDSYGHIVNINSIAGHSCISITKEPKLNVYAGSKHFVTATTEVLRQELNSLQNRKVRISVNYSIIQRRINSMQNRITSSHIITIFRASARV